MAHTQTADNTLYDTLSDTWWDENSTLNLLKTTINPWRVPYFSKLLKHHTDNQSKPILLDVGCGGGLLAEEFSSLGCQVTGIDPSEQSLVTARAHAQQLGLQIDYRCGFGDNLPFEDNHFDVVSCCDVLEHIEDWEATVAEIARVLKPGGLFLFDTINRTAYSWLVNIFIAQEFAPTRFMPKNLHVWRMFISPDELEKGMQRHKLQKREVVGASPKGSPVTALKAIRKFKQGKMTAQEVGAVAAMRPSRNQRGSYMGHAVKSV